MKKLLLVLSSFIFTTTSISNLSNITFNLNNNLQKNVVNQNISNLQTDDLTKLENWHNGLSIEQDEQAKQAYLDSMKITTTKSATDNIDKYKITFDNAKLQAMLKNKLINQDAYNIIINANTSSRLTSEANAIINVPAKNNVNIKIRAFQSNFYIENNKMHFVDKNNPNPYAMDIKNNNLKLFLNYFTPQIIIPTSNLIDIIESWWQFGYLKTEEADILLLDIDWMIDWNYTEEAIDAWFESYIIRLIYYSVEDRSILWQLLFEIGKPLNKANFYLSKYFFLNSLEKYKDKIKSVDSKYHQGVSETFYFWGLDMDPNSITAIPPMNKYSEINDEDKANYFNRGKKITNEYDNVPLLDYNGYDSLWQYLNTDGEAFNLNKIFKSYVGVLGKYNNLNYTFHHLEATAILKPYLNTWVTLTKTSWTNNNRETSLAQMQMMITDNPWTKTVEFNFKSILCNINALDSVGNEMFY